MSDVSKIAKKKGLEVVKHEPEYLFVDLDSQDALAMFEVNVDRLMEAVPELVRGRYIARSSGGNWHGYVYCTVDMTDRAKLLLHLLLGSDPEHEKLAFSRIVLGPTGRQWADPPFVFFESKDEAASTRAWMRDIKTRVRLEGEVVSFSVLNSMYPELSTHVLRNGTRRSAPAGCDCEHCKAVRLDELNGE